jgi:hypothetical protein
MVMLVGLVAVPAVALFGNGWTETVKQAVAHQLGINTTPSASTLSEAPLFVPGGAKSPVVQTASMQPLAPPVVSLPVIATPTTNAGTSPASPATNWPTMPTSPPTLASIAPVGGTPAGGVQNVIPTVSMAPAGSGVVQAVGEESARAAGMPMASTLLGAANGAVQPVSAVSPTSTPLVPVPPMSGGVNEMRAPVGLAAVAGNALSDDPRRLMAIQQQSANTERQPGPPAAPSNDRLGSMHARLRQLGATYCLLESWGPQSELYRFHCKVGIGGSTNFTRSFESTDPDPLGAVAKVVEQVEQWRSVRP